MEIREADWDVIEAAVLSAVPFTLAAAAMVAVAHHSRLRGERRWHVALPLLLAALAFGYDPEPQPL